MFIILNKPFVHKNDDNISFFSSLIYQNTNGFKLNKTIDKITRQLVEFATPQAVNSGKGTLAVSPIQGDKNLSGGKVNVSALGNMIISTDNTGPTYMFADKNKSVVSWRK